VPTGCTYWSPLLASAQYVASPDRFDLLANREDVMNRVVLALPLAVLLAAALVIVFADHGAAGGKRRGVDETAIAGGAVDQLGPAALCGSLC
jgi:hypothetical protein